MSAGAFASGLLNTSVRTVTSSQREQATQLIADLGTREAAIRANPDLTEPAKARAIAVVWATTKTKLAQLQADEDTYVAQRKDELDRSLYGQGRTSADATHIVAVRDAADRAARIETPDEAVTAMTRAHRDGDPVLVRAIAGVAADKGWPAVTNTYASLHPQLQSALDEQAALADMDTIQAKLGKAFAFGCPTPSGYNEHQLNALATEAQSQGRA